MPEQVFLRDLVFVLQGVDGNIIRMNERAGAFQLLPNVQTTQPVRQLVNKLAESGSFCHRIRRILSQPANGTVRQSINHAIEVELREYLKIVACFEATIASGELMTLRKALVWFNAAQLDKLRFIDTLLQDTDGLRGGALITEVSKYLGHGHPDVASTARLLTDEMLRPFYATLAEFVRHGSLQDPHGEFFITQAPKEADKTHESWMGRFLLDAERLPSVISSSLASKALLAGKTRAFLASISSLMDVDEDSTTLEQDAPNNIAALIKREHELACRQLSQLLTEKYSLCGHLRAVCDFIHFGRGDFATSLIEHLRYGITLILLELVVDHCRNRPVGYSVMH